VIKEPTLAFILIAKPKNRNNVVIITKYLFSSNNYYNGNEKGMIMPKKTLKQKEPEFYETLNPSLPFARSFESINPIPSSPLWVYPAWIFGSIAIGVLFGLAIKDLQQPAEKIGKPGIVAHINGSRYTVASAGLMLSQSASQTIQGTVAALQANQTSLQNGQNITAYQNGFSGYGQQGSVGTAAVIQ